MKWRCSFCNNDDADLMWNGHYYICKACLIEGK